MNPLLRPERGFLDHALAGIGCAAAGLAIGLSLNLPSFGFFLAGSTAVTTFLGYLIAKVLGDRKAAGSGMWLWVFFSLACFFMVRPLNNALPGQPFEFKTMIGATLSWMLIICPLVSWRDQTLLFLTLPSLAMFGLVGLVDYPQGTFLFFLFLLCAGILYSRVHQRSMLERAGLAGENRIELLRRGAWKWMAGPEWALASGCIIIVLSLLITPLLQASVQGVAGRVTMSMPSTPAPPLGNSSTAAISSDTFVGRGPNNPTREPVFKIKTDQVTLLRMDSMNVYSGSGWNRRAFDIEGSSPLVKNIPLPLSTTELPYFPWPENQPPATPMKEFERLEYEIIPLQRMSRVIPRPGPIIGVEQTPQDGYFTPGGDFHLNEYFGRNRVFRGVAAITNGAFFKGRDSAQADIQPEFQQLTETRRIHPAVRDQAEQVTQGLTGDYAKAEAIKRYIEKTCKYNLNAAAIPPNEDAARYFLFESREGYCDLFATAMTTMARSVGLPARYTLGYHVGDLVPDDQGYFTVREKDYHAWCEIYFDGYGWIPFDATEGAEAVPGGEVGASSDSQIPFLERPWVQDTLKVLLVVMLVVPTLLYLVRQLFQSRKLIKENEIVHLQNRFNNGVEILVRSPKRFSQTTADYVNQAAPKLGPLHEQARALADQFDEALYGPDDKRAGRAAELRPAVAAFRKAAREERKRAA